ncbi:MAG TPA: aspartate--tRNA(Asn) ligase [Rhizomicrobium sp.]|jgi:aspartyl-tRNA synthetase
MESDISYPRSPIGALRGRIGERVRIAGLIDAIRDHKRVQFLVVRDASGVVQVVREKMPGDAGEEPLTACSAVEIIGAVRDAPSVRLGGLELAADELRVHSLAASPLPIAAASVLEKQIDHRQISLRRPDQQLILAVQTTLEHAMRHWWAREGFTEIHSPKLMATFSESGADAFAVKYFGRSAFLAQSPQFYKQMAIAGGIEKVFEIGPAFRAEPSFTARHETEFTSIDMEVAWIETHDDLLRLEEEWLAAAIAAVAGRHGAEIAALLGVEIAIPTSPFPRVTMEEAQAIVRASGHMPAKTDDLDPEGERRLSAHIADTFGHEFVFVTDYPATARPFYHHRHDARPDLTRSFDLLFRGIEVTTGAQREHRYDVLRAQALERGYALEPLQSYLDFFRYGCPPHGGMGVGLARLLMALLHRQSVREVTLLSRSPTRLTP